MYKHKNTYQQSEVIMSTTRWNISVSEGVDQSLRMFLASQGGGEKGDLSRFIEEAVEAHIFELSAKEMKEKTKALKEDELNSIVDEALKWGKTQS